MASHTRGPWELVRRSNDGHDQWSVAAPEDSTYRTDANTCWIVHSPNGRASRAACEVETAANMRLIEMAPRLYDLAVSASRSSDPMLRREASQILGELKRSEPVRMFGAVAGGAIDFFLGLAKGKS